MRLSRAVLLLAARLLLAPIASSAPLPSCTNQLRVPNLPSGVNIQVTQYKLQNNVLHGEVRVANIFFSKTVTIGYATAAGVWTTLCSAYYGHGPYVADNGFVSNYETWKFNCPIGPTGISQFYIIYQTVGNGQTLTFYGNPNGPNTNFQVGSSQTANVAPALGFSADIDAFASRQSISAQQLMQKNLNVGPVSKHPNGGANGSVAAASFIQPRGTDYGYHWVRDGAIVYDAIVSNYASSKSLGDPIENLVFDHSSFNAKLQRIIRNTTAENLSNNDNTDPKYGGIGEPKFQIEGTQYFDGWCRPQNDGPALRASTLIKFANAYLDKGGDINRVLAIYNDPTVGSIKTDLDFIASNPAVPNNCDLWEETRSASHFFTDMVQRRAFHDGAAFAARLGDSASAAQYSSTAASRDASITSYFNSQAGLIQAIKGGRLLDAAIVEGVLHGALNDGVFTPNDDRLLATMYTMALGFNAEYTINLNVNADGSGLPIAPGIGRYFGDRYDGTPGDNNRLANPWYLSTAAFAEIYYKAATAYKTSGSITVTAMNLPFLSGPQPLGLGVSKLIAGTKLASTDPAFTSIVNSLKAVGDAYLRRVSFFSNPNGSLPEQFGRDCGDDKSAADLSWSYASVLTAINARNALKALP